MLQIACPDCANPLKVPPESIGNTVTCQACGQSFVISKPGTKAPELLPEVALQPVADDGDKEEKESKPVSRTEPQPPSPFTRPVSIVVFLGVSVYAVALLLFFTSLTSENTQQPHRPVATDAQGQVYVDRHQAEQMARTVRLYHDLLHDIGETESEIDSWGENDARRDHLATLKAKCERLESSLLRNLSRDELVKEDQKARADLQAAESALRTMDKPEDKNRAAWQRDKVTTLRTRCDKLEGLLKAKSAT